MIRIELHHSLARALLIVLVLASFLGLSVRIAKNYLGDRAAEGTSAEAMTRAIEMDPGNAQYHLRLARLALYSVSNASPELALEHLTHAAELSPRNVQVWLEFSAYYGFQGDTAKAEAFLRRADRMAPRIPSVQWVVGNFYLLQGNTDKAFRHFRTTLDGTGEYDRILFRTAWKASEDGAKILAELIPPRIGAQFSYLYYLLDAGKIPESLEAWKRIAATKEEFPAVRAASLLNRLIAARMPAEAAQVWSDLREKGLIKPTYQPTAQNLIINGQFEDDLFNAGFDWRISKIEGAEILIDGGTSHSPSHAVRVQFNGKSNLVFGHVSQYVRVEPGRRYRLQGFMKTEGITTDSGPRLRVTDPYDPRLLTMFSESLTGTTPGWTQVSLDFQAPPQTSLILVSLARQPSKKLDNQIAGTVWLDDVSLTPLP
jgi:Tfp pilus assembly protein PilF